MKRICAIALLAALAPMPAFAGEGLAASGARHVQELAATQPTTPQAPDRKSTRLNSSHT